MHWADNNVVECIVLTWDAMNRPRCVMWYGRLSILCRSWYVWWMDQTIRLHISPLTCSNLSGVLQSNSKWHNNLHIFLRPRVWSPSREADCPRWRSCLCSCFLTNTFAHSLIVFHRSLDDSTTLPTTRLMHSITVCFTAYLSLKFASDDQQKSLMWLQGVVELQRRLRTATHQADAWVENNNLSTVWTMNMKVDLTRSYAIAQTTARPSCVVGLLDKIFQVSA